jgi:hypothetical protein
MSSEALMIGGLVRKVMLERALMPSGNGRCHECQDHLSNSRVLWALQAETQLHYVFVRDLKR